MILLLPPLPTSAEEQDLQEIEELEKEGEEELPEPEDACYGAECECPEGYEGWEPFCHPIVTPGPGPGD